MDRLKDFIIPVQGLKPGIHHFEYEIDWTFFACFENSPVEQGRFSIALSFDKQNDHWLLIFEIRGAFDTECDRCLAPISLDIDAVHSLIVKYAEDSDAEDEAEVIYLSRDIRDWNIAQHIYEFVLLSIPVSRTYNCEGEEHPPCDFELLKKLEETSREGEGSGIWDALKDIQLND